MQEAAEENRSAGSLDPSGLYRQQLLRGEVVEDPAQASAVELLQDLFLRLQPGRRKRLGQLIRRIPFTKPAAPAKGLYIWGGVGRGKTWLLDSFYNLLPFAEKRRYHFHHFMSKIHAALNRLRGRSNPLRLIANELAGECRIICLDEFIVSDIGDAMILAGLLESLFHNGITLVTTSNTPPQELYRDGLQRSSFIPAIRLLQKHTRIIELDSPTDYRLRYLRHSTIYHCSPDEAVNTLLREEFDHLAPEAGREGGATRIAGREIPVVRLADDVAWFDFMALCGPPRSQTDYLELACRFHTVIVSDIPPLGPALDDATRRFIYLVDEFYDRRVKLILSAARPPASLYQGERLSFDFQRVVSRLQEMQSQEYLASAHRS